MSASTPTRVYQRQLTWFFNGKLDQHLGNTAMLLILVSWAVTLSVWCPKVDKQTYSPTSSSRSGGLAGTGSEHSASLGAARTPPAPQEAESAQRV